MKDKRKKNILLLLRELIEAGREMIISLLFPVRCPICDEILTPEEAEKGIHLACENKLYPVEGAVCMHCGRPLGQIKSKRNIQQNIDQDDCTAKVKYEDEISVSFRPEGTYEYCRECIRKRYVKSSSITQAKSLYLYKGAIKNSMYRLKYANKREYARFFARQAVEKYGEWLCVIPSEKKSVLSATNLTPVGASHIDVIVPVPMYLPKQKQRGYNQAECFAKEFSKLTGIPVDKDCICRVKDTTPQKELREQDRKNNLENAFQKGKSIVQYSHILVVDDIYTTGYTAEAVAKELRKQGGHHIYLLSVCIGGND